VTDPKNPGITSEEWQRLNEDAEQYAKRMRDAVDAQEAAVKATEAHLGKHKKLIDLVNEEVKLADTKLKLQRAEAEAHFKMMKTARDKGDLEEDKYQQELLSYQLLMKSYDAQEKSLELQTQIGGKMKEIGSFFSLVDDKSDSLLGNIVELSQNTGDFANAAYLGVVQFDDLLNSVNIAGSAFDMVVEGITAVVLELESALPAFNAAAGAGGKFNKEIWEVTQNTRIYGATAKESGESLLALMGGMANFNRMGATMRATLIGLGNELQALGVSAETTVSLVNSLTRSMGHSEAGAISAVKSVAMAAKQLDLPVGKMVQTFEASMPHIARFGKDAPDAFKKVMAAAKATGVEVGALLGMVSQYKTWDGAASAAGRLNAMLGGPFLNSIDFLNASYDEQIRMLIGTMEASGKSWATMGEFERQAYASAAGISDLNEAGNLFGTTLEEFDYQQREAERAQANAKDYNDMITAGISVAEKWKQVYQKAWGTLEPVITPVLNLLKSFADWLLKLSDGQLLVAFLASWVVGLLALKLMLFLLKKWLVGWSKDVGKAFGEGLSEAVKPVVDTLAESVDKLLSEAGEGAEDAIRSIGDGMESVSSRAQSAVPVILAVGAAFLMIGGAVALAAWGVSMLVESFAGFDAGQILAISVALLVFGATMVAMLVVFGLLVYSGIGIAAAGLIIAIGFAFLLMGAAVAIAALGMSVFVKAFAGMDPGQILAISLALAIFGATMLGLAYTFMMIMPILLAAAIMGATLVPIIWALGGAFLLMGVGVAIAALGMAQFVKAFAEMDAGKIMSVAMAMGILALSLMGVMGMMMLMLPAIPVTVAGIAALTAAFMIMALAVALVVIPLTWLFEAMLGLVDNAAGLSIIGTTFAEVAEAIDAIPAVKTVALATAFTGVAEAAASTAAAGGGATQKLSIQVDSLAKAVENLAAEGQKRSQLYKEMARKDLVIKIGDETVDRKARSAVQSWVEGIAQDSCRDDGMYTRGKTR